MTRGARPRFASVEDQFWAFVTPSNGCWEFGGKRNRDGYGTVTNPDGHGGGSGLLAHRVSWTIHFGPIPDGLCVLHRCDNPPCVNPGHLWLGTQLANSRDRAAKGRTRNGSVPGMPRKLWSRAAVLQAKALKGHYGMGSRRISHVVGVPERTVRGWIRDGYQPADWRR